MQQKLIYKLLKEQQTGVWTTIRGPSLGQVDSHRCSEVDGGGKRVIILRDYLETMWIVKGQT